MGPLTPFELIINIAKQERAKRISSLLRGRHLSPLLLRDVYDEFKGSQRGFKGNSKFKGSQREFKGSSKGVQREFKGSTKRVQRESKRAKKSQREFKGSQRESKRESLGES